MNTEGSGSKQTLIIRGGSYWMLRRMLRRMLRWMLRRILRRMLRRYLELG